MLLNTLVPVITYVVTVKKKYIFSPLPSNLLLSNPPALTKKKVACHANRNYPVSVNVQLLVYQAHYNKVPTQENTLINAE